MPHDTGYVIDAPYVRHWIKARTCAHIAWCTKCLIKKNISNRSTCFFIYIYIKVIFQTPVLIHDQGAHIIWSVWLLPVAGCWLMFSKTLNEMLCPKSSLLISRKKGTCLLWNQNHLTLFLWRSKLSWIKHWQCQGTALWRGSRYLGGSICAVVSSSPSWVHSVFPACCRWSRFFWAISELLFILLFLIGTTIIQLHRNQ